MLLVCLASSVACAARGVHERCTLAFLAPSELHRKHPTRYFAVHQVTDVKGTEALAANNGVSVPAFRCVKGTAVASFSSVNFSVRSYSCMMASKFLCLVFKAVSISCVHFRLAWYTRIRSPTPLVQPSRTPSIILAVSSPVPRRVSSICTAWMSFTPDDSGTFEDFLQHQTSVDLLVHARYTWSIG